MLVSQLLNAYDLQNFKYNIKNQRDDDASFKLIEVLYTVKNYNFIIKKNPNICKYSIISFVRFNRACPSCWYEYNHVFQENR